MRHGFLVMLGLMAALVCACGPAAAPEPTVVAIPVPVQAPPAGGVVACMDALASGRLVADARWGVALGQVAGPTIQVVWPAGFSARQVDGRIELLDERGAVVGRVGDVVTVAGGMGAGEAWFACGAPDRTP